MMIELGELIAEIDPQTVLVQGDTNSVLAASMTVSKMDSTLGSCW
jgi:UDP-N-acetylglucosamine 2-epimerase (non-hydrolysing)